MADTNGVGVEGNGNVHAPSVAVEMTTASAGARDTKEPRQRAYSGLAEAKHDAMSGDKDGDKEETDGEKKKEEPKPMVALGTLLRYMTCLDYSLYAIGVVAAGVNGLAMPAFSFVFGEILDNFNPGSGEGIADSVATASLWMSLAGAIAWVASYIEIACFNTVVRRSGGCQGMCCGAARRAFFVHCAVSCPVARRRAAAGHAGARASLTGAVSCAARLLPHCGTTNLVLAPPPRPSAKHAPFAAATSLL